MSGVLIEGHKNDPEWGRGLRLYLYQLVLDWVGSIVGIFRFMGVECEAKSKELIIR